MSGVGALWDCVRRDCDGGGGCTGGGVPLGAVPVLSWCGEVSLGGVQSSSILPLPIVYGVRHEKGGSRGGSYIAQ